MIQISRQDSSKKIQQLSQLYPSIISPPWLDPVHDLDQVLVSNTALQIELRTSKQKYDAGQGAPFI